MEFLNNLTSPTLNVSFFTFVAGSGTLATTLFLHSLCIFAIILFYTTVGLLVRI